MPQREKSWFSFISRLGGRRGKLQRSFVCVCVRARAYLRVHFWTPFMRTREREREIRLAARRRAALFSPPFFDAEAAWVRGVLVNGKNVDEGRQKKKKVTRFFTSRQPAIYFLLKQRYNTEGTSLTANFKPLWLLWGRVFELNAWERSKDKSETIST